MKRFLTHPATFYSGITILVMVTLYHVIFGFGIASRDVIRLKRFVDVLNASQTNPDFRKVVDGYCVEGSEVLRGAFWWVRAPQVVMIYRAYFARSGEEIVDEPGSKLHYEEFAKGALSSYLMLCSEQGLDEWAPVFESLGSQGITDDSARAFLQSFKMEEPVVTDRGAIDSVRRLHEDVGLSRPLAIRSAEEFTAKISALIPTLAAEVQVPPELNAMSPEQQLAAYRELDAVVRRTDFELWRVKQCSDFLAGVWGQTYGLQYKRNIEPFLIKRDRSRLIAAICVGLLVLLVGAKWATKKHVLGEKKILVQE